MNKTLCSLSFLIMGLVSGRMLKAERKVSVEPRVTFHPRYTNIVVERRLIQRCVVVVYDSFVVCDDDCVCRLTFLRMLWSCMS